MIKRSFLAGVLFLASLPGTGSPVMPADPPRGYVCYRTDTAPVIDGRLDDPAWERAPWTDDFVDIEGDRQPKPPLRTRVKLLWDDRSLYIGADLVEPHLWATLREHDSVIFHDNDFEFFIDPNGDNHEYYEFEMNALNTTWDLLLTRPYKDGGKAVNNWEIRGLQSAVHLDGTLNDPRDTDRGWTIELAVPWTALGELARRPSPPNDGDQWRVNFSRVEWPLDVVDGAYRPIAGRAEHNWVWSPQHVIDMHRPEEWGYVQFSSALTGTVPFRPDPTWPARVWLHRVYYAERDYRTAHGRWADTLADLNVPRGDLPGLSGFDLKVAGDLYEATVYGLHIRQDSLVWSEVDIRYLKFVKPALRAEERDPARR